MFLVISRQLFSVESASETVPPTMGTAVPINNFAVFEKALLPEEETMVPRLIIPEKIVAEAVNTQTAKFFIVFEISAIFMSETADAIHIAIYMEISGTIISSESLDITEETPSIRVLNPVAEDKFPEAIIAEE